jgi:hypothetical protein
MKPDHKKPQNPFGVEPVFQALATGAITIGPKPRPAQVLNQGLHFEMTHTQLEP